MPCYVPMVAGPIPGRTQSGKTRYKFLGKAVTYYHKHGQPPTKAILCPCRQCIGCKLERSRMWATRIMYELKYHPAACFLTLTYSPEHEPIDRSLNPSHLQTFIKDLRRRCDYHGKGKIRYYACGEYGDQTERPHYHLAIFGPYSGDSTYDQGTPGRVQEEHARSGAAQFTHPDFAATWPYGIHRFSELSFESAAYVARYILKKVTGVFAPPIYGSRIPEFQRQSQGLGRDHFTQWTTDIYPSDHVVLPGRGAFMPPPYYDRLLEKADPALYSKVKASREAAKEALTASKWYQHIYERYQGQEVRQLVTDSTLIRGGF